MPATTKSPAPPPSRPSGSGKLPRQLPAQGGVLQIKPAASPLTESTTPGLQVVAAAGPNASAACRCVSPTVASVSFASRSGASLVQSPSFVDRPLQVTTFTRRPSVASVDHNPLIDDLLGDLASTTRRTGSAAAPLASADGHTAAASVPVSAAEDELPANSSQVLLDHYMAHVVATGGRPLGGARVWPGNGGAAGVKRAPAGRGGPLSSGSNSTHPIHNHGGANAATLHAPLLVGGCSGSCSAVAVGQCSCDPGGSAAVSPRRQQNHAAFALAFDTVKQAAQSFVHAMRMHELDGYFRTGGDEGEGGEGANALAQARETEVRTALRRKSAQQTDALVLDLLDILEEVRQSCSKMWPLSGSLASLFPGGAGEVGERHNGGNGDTLSVSMYSTVSTASLMRPPVHETHKIRMKYDPLVKKKIINNYLVLANLGKGSYGKVKLGEDLTTKRKVAIKIIDKKHLQKKFGGIAPREDTEGDSVSCSLSRQLRIAGKAGVSGGKKDDTIAEAADDNVLKREIAIMKKVKHRNCVSLFEVIDDPSSQKLYLIMDYIPNGPVVKLKQNKVPRELIRNIEGNATVNNVIYNRYLIRCCIRQQLLGARMTRRSSAANSDPAPSAGVSHPTMAELAAPEARVGPNGVLIIDGDTPLTVRELCGKRGSRSFSSAHRGPFDALRPSAAPEAEFFLFSCKPVKEDVVFIYLRQLVSGLRYLHRKNVVHHDIKPDNILLGLNNKVYLTDFGVSEIFEKTDGGAGRSGRDSVDGASPHDDPITHKAPRFGAGTLLFTAPELFCEDPEALCHVNPFLTDVWALGVTIYCVLMGVSPFNGKNSQEISHSIRHVQFPFNGFTIENTPISPEWQTIFGGVLEKDPKKRWGLGRLRQFLDSHPVMQALYANGAVFAATRGADDAPDAVAVATASSATTRGAGPEPGGAPAQIRPASASPPPSDGSRSSTDASAMAAKPRETASREQTGGSSGAAAAVTAKGPGSPAATVIAAAAPPAVMRAASKATAAATANPPATTTAPPTVLTADVREAVDGDSSPISPCKHSAHEDSFDGADFGTTAAARVQDLSEVEIANATRCERVEVFTVFQKKLVVSEAARAVVQEYVNKVRFRVGQRRRTSRLLIPASAAERQQRGDAPVRRDGSSQKLRSGSSVSPGTRVFPLSLAPAPTLGANVAGLSSPAQGGQESARTSTAPPGSGPSQPLVHATPVGQSDRDGASDTSDEDTDGAAATAGVIQDEQGNLLAAVGVPPGTLHRVQAGDAVFYVPEANVQALVGGDHGVCASGGEGGGGTVVPCADLAQLTPENMAALTSSPGPRTAGTDCLHPPSSEGSFQTGALVHAHPVITLALPGVAGFGRQSSLAGLARDYRGSASTLPVPNSIASHPLAGVWPSPGTEQLRMSALDAALSIVNVNSPFEESNSFSYYSLHGTRGGVGSQADTDTSTSGRPHSTPIPAEAVGHACSPATAVEATAAPAVCRPRGGSGSGCAATDDSSALPAAGNGCSAAAALRGGGSAPAPPVYPLPTAPTPPPGSRRASPGAGTSPGLPPSLSASSDDGTVRPLAAPTQRPASATTRLPSVSTFRRLLSTASSLASRGSSLVRKPSSSRATKSNSSDAGAWANTSASTPTEDLIFLQAVEERDGTAVFMQTLPYVQMGCSQGSQLPHGGSSSGSARTSSHRTAPAPPGPVPAVQGAPASVSESGPRRPAPAPGGRETMGLIPSPPPRGGGEGRGRAGDPLVSDAPPSAPECPRGRVVMSAEEHVRGTGTGRLSKAARKSAAAQERAGAESAGAGAGAVGVTDGGDGDPPDIQRILSMSSGQPNRCLSATTSNPNGASTSSGSTVARGGPPSKSRPGSHAGTRAPSGDQADADEHARAEAGLGDACPQPGTPDSDSRRDAFARIGRASAGASTGGSSVPPLLHAWEQVAQGKHSTSFSKKKF